MVQCGKIILIQPSDNCVGSRLQISAKLDFVSEKHATKVQNEAKFR
jgi:hypothetical protein